MDDLGRPANVIMTNTMNPHWADRDHSFVERPHEVCDWYFLETPVKIELWRVRYLDVDPDNDEDSDDDETKRYQWFLNKMPLSFVYRDHKQRYHFKEGVILDLNRGYDMISLAFH